MTLQMLFHVYETALTPKYQLSMQEETLWHALTAHYFANSES
jgi:hypothetical protein